MVDKMTDESERSPVWQMGVTNTQTNNAQLVQDTLSSKQPINNHQKQPNADKWFFWNPERQLQLFRILRILKPYQYYDIFACVQCFKDANDRRRRAATPQQLIDNHNFPTISYPMALVKAADAERRCSLQQPGRIPTGEIPTRGVSTRGVSQDILAKIKLNFPKKKNV